jgi:cell division protein FtsB
MSTAALQYRPEPARKPRGNARVARGAAMVRRQRTASMRYRAIVRTLATLAVLTFAVVAYLGLMANVTRMNFEYTKVARDRARLLDESVRLDDQIAHLQSRERLAALASRLGMRESGRFQVATIPSAPRLAEQPAHGLALLPAVSDWLR